MRAKNYILPAWIFMFLVMFILPFFSDPNYSFLLNTTSHLGAQGSKNAWLMNMTFIALGSSTILEAWVRLKKYPVQKILLSFFGLSLIFTGSFRHAPIVSDISNNLLLDRLHSIFASLVGFSFTVFCISTIFIEKNKKRRLINILVVALVTFLSLLMMTLPNYSGIWQRLIFIISFSWLLYFLKENR